MVAVLGPYEALPYYIHNLVILEVLPFYTYALTPAVLPLLEAYLEFLFLNGSEN
jgi:hypothetical protein